MNISGAGRPLGGAGRSAHRVAGSWTVISFTDRQRSELRSTSLAGSGGRRGQWVGHSANVTERLRDFLDEILPQNVPHPSQIA